jgi:hypothetical protein
MPKLAAPTITEDPETIAKIDEARRQSAVLEPL